MRFKRLYINVKMMMLLISSKATSNRKQRTHLVMPDTHDIEVLLIFDTFVFTH